MFESPIGQRTLRLFGMLCIIATAYLAVLAVGAVKNYRYIGAGIPSANVITVTGDGEVFAVPDVAEIGFSVTVEKANLTDAQSAAAQTMNAAIAYLKSQGVDEKDIKTTNYSANPRYEYTDKVMADGSPEVMIPYPTPNDHRVLAGYDVTQTVSVKVRDTSKAGAILSGVGKTGVTDMYGPNFTIDDDTKIQEEARSKAIDNAKDKAEKLAAQLGVDLVRIVSFSENGGGYYPMYRADVMSAGATDKVAVPPEIPAGQNKISSSVSITYEIR